MLEAMQFFTDLWGAVASPKFYRQVLARPPGKAWRFLLLLALSVAIALTAAWTITLVLYYRDAVNLVQDKIKTVNITEGRITNMPRSHKELSFRGWTIHIDTVYLNTESILADLDSTSHPALFVGPQKAFVVIGDRPIAFDYPNAYSVVVDAAALERYRLSFLAGSALLILIGTFVYRFLIGLLYVLLIIAPILSFKFRRQGMAYGQAVRAGLYLASIEVLLAAILSLLKIDLPWGFVWFILFYIVYIGAVVNIDVSAAAGGSSARDADS